MDQVSLHDLHNDTACKPSQPGYLSVSPSHTLYFEHSQPGGIPSLALHHGLCIGFKPGHCKTIIIIVPKSERDYRLSAYHSRLTVSEPARRNFLLDSPCSGSAQERAR
ncbi:hypothetical protein LCGC14_0058910 [marine sediment metagenome]|uniref:Uncharacterized protein n=1 Tax=marine sediment metagenome TaxID=412755 RepID=A0A0F9W500_9ZZZZ|nr:hypothetical protein [Halomonas sp.]HDZ47593.1 hypothetical protein [Halomonas sp.]HEB05184.1 hypothetical protein [Halomonas sp.]